MESHRGVEYRDIMPDAEGIPQMLTAGVRMGDQIMDSRDREPLKINVDSTPENADWIRSGAKPRAYTVEEFEAMLAQDGMTVDAFRRLPIYGWHREHWDRIIGQLEDGSE